MDKKNNKDKPPLESIFIPAYPIIKAPFLKTQQQIFVASLPVICEPDIVIKTEDDQQDDDCEVKETKSEKRTVETPPPPRSTTFFDHDDTSSSSDDYGADDNDFFEDAKYRSKTKSTEKGSISENKSLKDADGTEYKVTCKMCTMGFQRISNYKTHMKKKHKIDLNESEDGTRRKVKKRLSTAERRLLEPKIKCSICSMGFQRSSNYTSHMKKIHKIVGDATPFSCPNCPRKYEFEYELKRHMKKYIPLDERLIFPCPQCDRKFQTKVHVTRHIQFVHDNSRPFICEECGEAVHTRTILREHMLTHTDYSPYECKVCGKSFKQKQRLKRHMDIHGEKHICTVCGKELSSRCTLNKHLLVHTEDKAHKCEFCGRAFKLIKTLKVHLNIHTGEKRYECNFCDKVFSAPSTRRQHKKKKHPEKLLELEMLKAKSHIKNDETSGDNSLASNPNDKGNNEAMDYSSSMNQPTTSAAMFFKNTAIPKDYPLPDFRMLDFVGRMMME
ncbi:zinc finger protein OZF isoform X1 [Zeugodacus cucurbitae]|uniref:zinc finger protein OZF isoform X1 n=1 Tax=Zeugodacus cucurbitae TaxID=28588 RepID=UPI0023D93714|nr:zinc finger protein OZF isoform X1 [Zeugodacus cucurbitae]